MVGKCKSLVIFIAVVGVACIVLNFAGIDAQVYAQGAANVKSSECPLDKGEKCSSDNDCSKKPKCDKGGCDNIDKMMDLTRCAKKELLKEKIKANLEKKMGTKLDKIADLLVDAMLNEYKASMGCKTQRATLENNIREVFSGKGSQ
ncbi:MAG: hypothetical protein K8F52_09380 [Candidatus Scalindua rubra]|uniref:Uncharacterized protein n=1 Tax=Candidatus Scalindua brodae TaxID=237368 RepID=A0A0B0EGD0_9BACT|nr:MAG: hypothetical protein SCABRO_03108 [Candidatus Scalindua brodae]MBZ0108870.1 hypothetical protein [Candidatus Scalindua rubra]TWU34644.1 hypothetical protein S225a_10020 [Candidatus Brocadiaceae bacterium S225]